MITKKKIVIKHFFFSAEDTSGIYSVHIIVVEAELVFTLKEHIDSLFQN